MEVAMGFKTIVRMNVWLRVEVLVWCTCQNFQLPREQQSVCISSECAFFLVFSLTTVATGLTKSTTLAPSSASSQRAGSRSRLVAPKVRAPGSARHSPYGARPPAALRQQRNGIAETKTSRDERELDVSRVDQDVRDESDEGARTVPSTPEDKKSGGAPATTPSTSLTWGEWAKKVFTGSTKKKPVIDSSSAASASSVGRLLFGTKSSASQKESNDENSKDSKKRYSFPGGFDDGEEKENRDQNTSNNIEGDPYANPYIKMEDYKPLSKSFTTTIRSSPRPMSPLKRSVRGISASFDENKLRTNISFHPYARSPRTARFTPRPSTPAPEESKEQLSAEEELKMIEKRRRDRMVQELEDRYRARILAKKSGEPYKEPTYSEKEPDLDDFSPASTQEDNVEEEPKEEAKPKAAEKEKSTTRRGFGLFDDEEDDEIMEEIQVPVKSTQSLNTLPFSTFASSDNVNTPNKLPGSPKKDTSSSQSSSEVSPDSDKENYSAFFNEPIPTMPPAPVPSHAKLPSPSKQPTPLSNNNQLNVKKQQESPAPLAKAKAQAEKFRPTKPSGLRESTTAPPPATPAMESESDAVKPAVLAIPAFKLDSFNWPAGASGFSVVVNEAVQKNWKPDGQLMEQYSKEFMKAIAAL